MGRQPKKSTAPVLRRVLANGLAAAWPTESAAGQAGGHAISLRHHRNRSPASTAEGRISLPVSSAPTQDCRSHDPLPRA